MFKAWEIFLYPNPALNFFTTVSRTCLVCSLFFMMLSGLLTDLWDYHSVQVHLYGDLITHRWIVFIIISHLGQHWIIQRSSLNFWTEFAALKVKGLNNFEFFSWLCPTCCWFLKKKYSFISLCLKPEMWQKVAKFKGAEYFRKALYMNIH